MEFRLIQKPLEVERLVGDSMKQVLVTTETMVPGAGRDQVRPLIADATLVIHHAEVQQDQVVLDGTVFCQALYRQGDESSVRALSAEGKLSQIINIDGASSGQILRVAGDVEHVEPSYENGHMVFRVAVALHAQVSELSPISLIEDIEGRNDIEKHYVDITGSKLAAEAHAGATLHEEVNLPAELDARMALMDMGDARIHGIQPDLGGVRVRGEVMTETWIGTGVAGRPVAKVSVALPFDEVVELPEWLSANVVCDAQIARLQTSVQEGAAGRDGMLGIECALSIKVSAVVEEEVRALQDAFATDADGILVEQMPIEVKSGVVQHESIEAFKGSISLGAQAPGAGAILCVKARPTLADWVASRGQTELSGIIEAQVLYLESSGVGVSVIREELPFTAQISGELPADAWVRVSAMNAESGALMSDRLEIRCQMKIAADYRHSNHIVCAVSAEASGPEKRRDGIILTWPQEGDSAWGLAKKYKIPVATVGETLVKGRAAVLRI